MKYKQDDKTYSVKGKPIKLVIGILIFVISCFLLYILGFYCVKFANTYKPLFKVGLNDELKDQDYDKPTVLILDKGFIQVNYMRCSVVQVSENGSYILNNGIIVLMEEDEKLFFEDKLVFFDNKNTLIK